MVMEAKTVTLTPEQFQQMMEKMSTQSTQIDTLLKVIANLTNGNGNGKKGNGGRHTPKPVLDIKTGIVYRTESSAGKAVAPEYGLPVHNYVWYELVKGTKDKPAKCPDRFKPVTMADYEAFEAKKNAQVKSTPAPQQPQQHKK